MRPHQRAPDTQSPPSWHKIAPKDEKIKSFHQFLLVSLSLLIPSLDTGAKGQVTVQGAPFLLPRARREAEPIPDNHRIIPVLLATHLSLGQEPEAVPGHHPPSVACGKLSPSGAAGDAALSPADTPIKELRPKKMVVVVAV